MQIEDRYDTLQRVMTVGVALGSISMAVQFTLIELGVKGLPVVIASLSSLAGWGLFGLMVVKTKRLGTTDEGRSFLRQAVADERLDTIRHRAFSIGFAVVIAVQIAALVLDAFFVSEWLTPSAIATITIGAGVSVSLISYHRLQDRER